jgi:hypothetical protein
MDLGYMSASIRVPHTVPSRGLNDCKTDEELSWSVLHSMPRANSRFC